MDFQLFIVVMYLHAIEFIDIWKMHLFYDVEQTVLYDSELFHVAFKIYFQMQKLSSQALNGTKNDCWCAFKSLYVVKVIDIPAGRIGLLQIMIALHEKYHEPVEHRR